MRCPAIQVPLVELRPAAFGFALLRLSARLLQRLFMERGGGLVRLLANNRVSDIRPRIERDNAHKSRRKDRNRSRPHIFLPVLYLSTH
jgi:hypothetical protein